MKRIRGFFQVAQPVYYPAPPELAAALRAAYTQHKHQLGQEPTDEELARVGMVRPATGLYSEYRYRYPGPKACLLWLLFGMPGRVRQASARLYGRLDYYRLLRENGLSFVDAAYMTLMHYEEYEALCAETQEATADGQQLVQYTMDVGVAGEEDAAPE